MKPVDPFSHSASSKEEEEQEEKELVKKMVVKEKMTEEEMMSQHVGRDGSESGGSVLDMQHLSWREVRRLWRLLRWE